jgi:hypothetical protein
MPPVEEIRWQPLSMREHVVPQAQRESFAGQRGNVLGEEHGHRGDGHNTEPHGGEFPEAGKVPLGEDPVRDYSEKADGPQLAAGNDQCADAAEQQPAMVAFRIRPESVEYRAHACDGIAPACHEIAL